MSTKIPIIAANWKMYKTKDEALDFIFKVNQSLPDRKLVDSVVFAPAILLNLLVKREGDNLRIGAQNMHYADEGAYTGQNSPLHVKTAGAEYVLIGHSEVRTHNYETDKDANLKLHAAFRHAITPLLCIGESLTVRENGTTNQFIKEQLERCLEGIEERHLKNLVIAYEPIWAIGTGLSATPAQANDQAINIKNTLKNLYSPAAANLVKVIYGGSINPTTIEGILKEPNIDGALIGNSALDANNFIMFCETAKKVFSKK